MSETRGPSHSSLITDHASLLTLRSILFALALIVITVGSHMSALDGWWGGDDPQVLLHAIRNSPAETLFSPDAWQTLSASNFTPLVTLSFEIDYALFGLRPLFFYQHQLLSIVVAVLLLHVLLEPVTGRWIAFLTAVAAGAGPAMALGAESLMIRHYVEGLALALAALIVWRAGDGTRFGAARDSGSALLYLLAMAAKEVFATLPLIFLGDALARGLPLRTTIRRLAPSAVAAALYLAWRYRMLDAAGGYGAGTGGSPAAAAWHLYQSLYASAPALVFAGVPLLLVVAAIAGLRAQPRATIALGLALVAALVLPLVPVLGLAEARYALVPGVAIVAFAGLGLSQLPRRWGIAAAAALAALQLVAGFALHGAIDRSRAVEEGEGRYVFEAPASAPPLLASSPGWYLGGLRDLRRIDGGGAAPPFVLSREALLVGAVEPEAVVQVGADGAPFRDPGLVAWIASARRERDPSLSIEVDVRKEGDRLLWRLGPAGRQFTWLTVPEYDEYPVGPAGARTIPEAPGLQWFRILAETAGTGRSRRWNVTPVFEVPGDGAAVRWSSAEN